MELLFLHIYSKVLRWNRALLPMALSFKEYSAVLLSLQRSRGLHSLMVSGRILGGYASFYAPLGNACLTGWNSNGPAISRIPGARVVSAPSHLSLFRSSLDILQLQKPVVCPGQIVSAFRYRCETKLQVLVFVRRNFPVSREIFSSSLTEPKIKHKNTAQSFLRDS